MEIVECFQCHTKLPSSECTVVFVDYKNKKGGMAFQCHSCIEKDKEYNIRQSNAEYKQLLKNAGLNDNTTIEQLASYFEGKVLIRYHIKEMIIKQLESQK